MRVYYTKHAIEVLKERDISSEMVESVLKNPEQVIERDNVSIAQSIVEREDRKYLLRVFFVKEEDGIRIKVITIYLTSKIEKYWRSSDEN